MHIINDTQTYIILVVLVSMLWPTVPLFLFAPAVCLGRDREGRW